MRSALLTLALAVLLSACRDSSPIGPTPTTVAASLATVDADDPLDDAIARIAPAFGDGADAVGLGTALLRVKSEGPTALVLAEQSLARLERVNPAFAADVDAVRLALLATR